MADDGDSLQPSMATTSLTKVSQGLGSTSDLLLRVNPPVQELTALLVRVDGYFGDASGFLTMISRICTLLHDGLQLCKWVGGLIPEIGPIIADGAKFIENLQIEQTIRRIANEINDVIKRARNGVLSEVKKAAGFVASKLESLTEKMPSWSDTVTLMSHISHLIDIIVFTAFKDMKDDAIKLAVDALNKSFGGILTDVENISKALDPIKQFIQNSWAKFKEDILAPIQSGFGAILDLLKPVMGVIQTVCNACSTIKEWFEPFMWVLKAVEWIFDMTVGWLIKKILNVLHINDLIEDFKNWLMKALGVQAAKDAINKVVSDALEVAKQPLRQIEEAVGVNSIAETAETLTIQLVNFRKDPAGALMAVIASTGVLDELKDWDKPIRIPIDDINSDVPNDDDLPAASQAAKVKETQLDIDDFVANIGAPSPDRPADDSTPPKPVPKLRYAVFDDQPVSVRMRTTHKNVIDSQASARSKPLATLDDATPDVPASDDTNSPQVADDESITSSDGLAPNFDLYITKCSTLLTEIAKANQYLDRAETAFKQADADFASFRPEAVAFCDELVLLLRGTDRILDAVDAALALPLQYRGTLTNKVKQWLKDAEWPEGVLTIVDELFVVVDTTKQAVANLRTEKTTTQSHAEEASTAYKNFIAHVARACSPDIFPKSMGPSVFTLATFIASIKQRLNSTVTSLIAIRRVGCRFFKKDTVVGDDADKKAIAAKLNEIYGSLNTVVDATLTQAQAFPGQVDKVYLSLSEVHSNVQKFFVASKDISDHCRTVEAKLIAADRVRAFCLRINNAIGPFQSVLDQLGVHADSAEATAAAVADLKAFGRLDSAVQLAVRLLNSAIFAAISSLLKDFFRLADVDTPMLKLTTDLNTGFAAHLTSFESELATLIALVAPAKTSTYTLPTAAGQPAGPTFVLENPLMDDSTAKSLGAVFQQIVDLVKSAQDKPKIVTMAWAQPTAKPMLAIESVYLDSWAAKWDAVEPAHPSSVWVAWYKQLQTLDQLMTTRSTWQRLDPAAPPATSCPFGEADANLQQLWNSFETKATAGGAQYLTAIQSPLQKPLQQRIYQLFEAVVQLPAPADGTDLLKQLPAPGPPTQPPAPATQHLSPQALEMLKGMYSTQTLPAPLASMVEDQKKFADLSRDMQLYMAAAGPFFTQRGLGASAGSDALAGLSRDYVLVEARTALEETRDAGRAEEFAKVAGGL